MNPGRSLPLLGISALAAGVQLGPMVSSIPAFRRHAMRKLSGISSRRHIALTYDDGPDATSTPRFLDLLAEYDVRATFFLLGEHAMREPHLTREMAEAGHELAVHGWSHTCVALSRPGVLSGDVRRTRETLEDLTGRPVRWYRPPYGVLTAEGIQVARRSGLDTMLWSAWGRDWSRRSTPSSIEHTVLRTLRPGGTVLLHDSDRTSCPGSWRGTLAASRRLLERWRDEGLAVGPLCEHW